MRRIPSEIINEIKHAVSIEAEASRYVELRPAPGNQFTGCCPFHEEKTPSFRVYDDGNPRWRCYGACNTGGDVFKLHQNMTGMTFVETVVHFAEQTGIELPDRVEEPDGPTLRQLRDAMQAATNIYRDQFLALPNDHPAVRMITDRGLPIDGPIWYGYAPAGRTVLHDTLTSQGITLDVLIEAGLCGKTDKGRIYDVFRDRLLFLFTDPAGQPIGFSARQLHDDGMGKYINTRTTRLFPKSKTLYNHMSAAKPVRDTGTVYITEGQFDVAAMVHAGLDGTVAASGTAFTAEHVARLAMMAGRNPNTKMVFCFDGDQAGRTAGLKVFTLNPDLHTQGYVVAFPEGIDPCDMGRQDGWASLARYVHTNQVELWRFVLDTLRNDYTMSTPAQVGAWLQHAAGFVAAISNPSVRRAATEYLALHGHVTITEAASLVDRTEPVKVTNLTPVRLSSGDQPPKTNTGDQSPSRATDPDFRLSCVLIAATILPGVDAETASDVLQHLDEQWAWIVPPILEAKRTGTTLNPEQTRHPELTASIVAFADQQATQYDVLEGGPSEHETERIATQHAKRLAGRLVRSQRTRTQHNTHLAALGTTTAQELNPQPDNTTGPGISPHHPSLA